MATDSNIQMLANYRKAITALETKLARQLGAADATAGQIQGFKALVAQLEAKK